MASEPTPLLRVRDLRVEVTGEPIDIVDAIDFDLCSGEILGLVGESGCGKTAVAMAMLGYARPGTRIGAGEIWLQDTDVLALGGAALRRLRGGRVSYVPQDPSRSLNPRQRVGAQIDEALRVHGNDPASSSLHVAELFEAVRLPHADAVLRRYPHELSGGQQQRIILIIALACQPDVVVLDEPTTGLDVTTQAHVLTAISNLRGVSSCAFLYVTHDIAVIANLADRLAVMYAGRIVESGPTRELLEAPAHPYTTLLLASTPSTRDPTPPSGLPGMAPPPGQRPDGCAFAPRCPLARPEHFYEQPSIQEIAPGHTVRCFRWREASSASLDRALQRSSTPSAPGLLEVSGLRAWYGKDASATPVLVDVELTVGEGECLAIVGESGSGKSTLARCIAGLHRSQQGTIRLGTSNLRSDVRHRIIEDRRAIQLVYQNPDRSLNPRRTVGDQIARPLLLFGINPHGGRYAEMLRLLARVRLPASTAERYPGELSGGEKQRVAIARALAARPKLLLCDELTSALDVSVQAAILELLTELQAASNLSLLFISHDLAVVSTIADRIVVLLGGIIRETGTTAHVIANPEDDYTRELIAASPELPPAPNRA